MIKYLAITNSFRGQDIFLIEIDRESKSSIWIKERRYSKLSGLSGRRNYFDTFDEAKNFLLKYAQKNIDKTKKTLKHQQKYYDRIKNLKEIHNEPDR